MIEQLKTQVESNLFLTKHKKILIPTVKIFIAIGLLYYLVYNIQISDIINAATEANVSLLLITLALSVVNLYIQFYKWKITVSTLLNENSNRKIFYSLFLGFSAAVFTPARIGEYFGRAIAFKDKSLLQVTLATLIDKLFPLLIVAFFGSIASILFIHFYYDVSFYLTVSLFIVLFVLFYFIVLLIFNKNFWDNLLFNRIQRTKILSKYFDKISKLKNLDHRYSIKMIFVSLLFYLCYLIQYVILVSAFSHHYEFIDYFWAGNLLMFSKTIIPPVSFGELGIREGASVFFIQQFGENAAVGFNASIFLFIINVLLPALVGLSLIFRKNDD
ncbi:MAG: flippase-like domain-containing protein [Ignavibacterium sp.]|nr:flippase-like domain-containing protein [Ignavibacterium sp.]